MERSGIVTWIVQTLKNDAALMDIVSGVWHRRAGQGQKFPFVVIRRMASDDTNSLGQKRVTSDLMFQVVIEGEDGADYDEAGAVGRIDALLHGAQRLDVAPRFVCQRESEIDGDTFGSGLSTRMAGGIYRFLVNGEK